MKSPDTLSGFYQRFQETFFYSMIAFGSYVFLYDIGDEKIAIVLVIIQEASDFYNEIEMFVVGTLISSLHIINVNHNIRRADLEFLQLAIQFSKFLKSADDSTSFQKLFFLVNDWTSVREHDYSVEGGKNYLKMLRQQFRRSNFEALDDIYEAYDNISCYLMPYVGNNVEKRF
jgi:Guanylate-binding protein, N-terminal domain